MYNSKTCQKGNRILVPNEYTKKLVHDYYNVSLNKISIVTNGTEIDNYKKSDLNSNQIIFSGAMYHHRGIDVLLESVSKVTKKIPDSKFVLLGDGPEMEELKKMVYGKEISKNVIFKGWVDRNEIPKYLSESSIGIGPLRNTEVTRHALPIKVLEYMASGLPILAIKDTLPEDVLKNDENGFFVTDSVELSKKIIKLLEDNELRRKMGEKSKKMVTKFDWKNVAELIIQESQEVIFLSK